MKVSTKWLNEYVPVADLEPLALAEKSKERRSKLLVQVNLKMD